MAAPTGRELAAVIGKSGRLTLEGWAVVDAEILDSRVVWGRVQYLVAPVGGEGEAWVDAARVRPLEGKDTL